MPTTANERESIYRMIGQLTDEAESYQQIRDKMKSLREESRVRQEFECTKEVELFRYVERVVSGMEASF